MGKAVIENHRRYLKRINFYKSFGYDVEKERSFIIEKAQPLYGDILEVGTGKGYFAVALAKEEYSFTSIDISKNEQQIARLNIKYFGFEKLVDFKIENAEHLSFENDSFDIIFSVNVLHHLINPFKVIDELIRIVTFEGKIILSDFTKEGLGTINKIHISEGRKHEASNVKLNEIENYLLDRDFRIQKHRDRFEEVLIVYHQTI